MTWLKVCAATAMVVTSVSAAQARDVTTALWQETDLSGAPQVVQDMDACLQDFAAWQDAAETEAFSCRVATVDPSPETSEAIQVWADQQFGTSEGWTVEEGARIALIHSAIGDRTTGAGYQFSPTVETDAPLVSIGLVSGTVAGCDTGTAFSILATSPELGVPAAGCYDLSSF